MHAASLRALHLLAVLVTVSFLSFVLVDWLPGDAAQAALGERADAAELAALRAELGLDDPLPVRYLRWAGGVAAGDFGVSLRSGEPVTDALAARLPVTLELIILAQGLALCAALGLALMAARAPGGRLDAAISTLAFALLSMPAYVVAIVLIAAFAVSLNWLPATGFQPLRDGLGGNLRSLALPALALAMTELPVYFRVLRHDLLRVLDEPWIQAARGRGVPPARILFRHALRPAATNLVTIMAIHTGHLIGGAVVLEQLFALPGLGRLLVDSVFTRDYPVVQGLVLVAGVLYVTINLCSDAIARFLDPPLRAADAAR